MKRIPIAELEGAALDWAVDRADGGAAEVARGRAVGYWHRDVHDHGVTHRFETFHPSKDWSQCGPLIERFFINIQYWSGLGPEDPPKFSAEMATHIAGKGRSSGDTMLIAACRAIVAAHNPDGFVEVPDEVAP